MIDLHVHTCFSDGEHTPKDVIGIAKKNGVSAISITDHDSVFGIREALLEGKRLGVNVIPGIEITAFDDREIHVLGYNLDFKSKEIISYVEWVQSERDNEVKRIFTALDRFNIKLIEDDVYKFREGTITTIWHFAKAIFEKGYTNSIKEALDKFFYSGVLGDIEYNKISVRDAIRLISDNGGVPVLAHPGRLGFSFSELVDKLKEWKALGLHGIEAVYSLNSDDENRRFLELAKELNLGVTMGSDYHGENIKPAIEVGNGVNGAMKRYEWVMEDVKAFLNF